jgi:hypothetical protein
MNRSRPPTDDIARPGTVESLVAALAPSRVLWFLWGAFLLSLLRRGGNIAPGLLLQAHDRLVCLIFTLNPVKPDTYRNHSRFPQPPPQSQLLLLFPTYREMPNVTRLAAREVLLQPLPSLRIGKQNIFHLN